MSVVTEERNDLLKRFKKQAVISIDDTLYSSRLLLPDQRNKRLFPVHDEAVERLNSTMQRHIDGNAQIWETMIYKDQPRSELVKQFWNGLIATEEFRKLPEPLRELELEQAKKLGPTSRFTIEKLFDGFVNHIDEEAKTKNLNYEEYEEAAVYFTEYLIDCCKEALQKDPSLQKYVKALEREVTDISSLPKDKSGGDPYYIRTDRKISGTTANNLYLKDAKKIRTAIGKRVYYTMFIRVQNKGNNIVTGFEEVQSIPEQPWLPEKNRVVQGDSRAWQFILKPMSDIITKIPKTIDPIFVGWANQDEKNEIIGNSLREYHGSVLFDNFDATDYDASTDPKNFALGISIIWNVCRALNPKAKLLPLDYIIEHYLNDPTLTPWGAFLRDSTPSGHNFTGPNGTVTNGLRCFVQDKRRLKMSFAEYVSYLAANRAKKIANFSCVGDDAFQLREIDRTPESIAEENNSDGYTSNRDKILLSRDFIHFLQFGYYYNGTDLLVGYYPISRVMEHCLWQETANQYTAESVSVQACVQNLNNARFNPLQPYGIAFLMEGDPKYRLGFKGGVMNLFKAASGGKSPAEFLGREWDPSVADLDWEGYSESLRTTVSNIEAIGRKFGY